MINFDRVCDFLNKNTDVFEAAIKSNGTTIQSVIAMEEIAEMQYAFIGFISNPHNGNSHKENLAEEIADVCICIKQLQLMYDLTDDIYTMEKSNTLVGVADAYMILSNLQKSISKTIRGVDTDLQSSIQAAIQIVNYYSFATKQETLEEWLHKKVEKIKDKHIGVSAIQ